MSQFPGSSKVAIMPGSKPGERRGGEAGFVASALAIARDVAPYYDGKFAPLIAEPPQESEEDKARRLHAAMREM